MRRVLPRAFFNRPTLRVARELLGKFLVRRYRGKIIAAMIIEVEAYDGFRDKASHASRGKTLRNAPMFGEAGRWYVYFTYGMHWMLNVVTREKGHPAAILIRGVSVIPASSGGGSASGGKAGIQNGLAISGPARLTKYFHIDKRLNNAVAGRASGLWIEDRGVRVSKIRKGPRIGVDYAGPLWAGKRYRFTCRASFLATKYFVMPTMTKIIANTRIGKVRNE